MRTKWVDVALDDLREIADYISKENPNAAKRMVSRLWTAVSLLGDHPEIGRPGRVYGTRELVISNTPFIVPYRIIDNEIQILRVLHGARDWPKHL